MPDALVAVSTFCFSCAPITNRKKSLIPSSVRLSAKKMKSDLQRRPLKALVDAYIGKELRVNPDYQRGLQWTVVQRQGLLDSILRGYQIPLFYIHLESRTNNYTRAVESTAWIVDGQQRLAAIVAYWQNEFSLPDPSKARPGTVLPVDPENLPSWTGKKFQDLGAEEKTRLLNFEVLIVEISAERNEVRDLFIRLQAGTPLTAQEKRDAWPGDFTNFIIRHAGKPGHHLSSPKPFFNQFKKKNSKRLSVADGEHYVDGHAEMRKFFAGLAMTIMLRERSNTDFVDLKGKTINEFYLQNLDLPDNDPAAVRVANLLDLIVQLSNFDELKEGSPMSFQMAFHFAVMVDSLSKGNYSSNWKRNIVQAFLDFKKALAEARLQHKETRETLPYYERFGRLLGGSGSDTAEIIRLRHAFMLSEIYPKMDMVPLDPNRAFDLLEREVIWNRDRGMCQCPKCHRPDRRVPFREATIHHIVEHCAGGPTNLRNGVLVCPECHSDRLAMQQLAPLFAAYIEKIYSNPTTLMTDAISDDAENETNEANGAARGNLKITVDWGVLDIDRAPEDFSGRNDSDAIVKFIARLIEEFGKPMTQQLLETPIVRFPLSAEPDKAFVNRSKNRPYSYAKVPGTGLYFCGHSERSQKIERLKSLSARLTLPDGDGFPADSIKVFVDGNETQ